ncbi:plant-specific TFIIB-related protein PTF2 [Cocos nucifera]|uniref:Plant-specific TFIIB-related protein PTF2 n=1 Tax=Cocos nucifera TaxID=13894 RepID=A0A8K0N141_COCNU|nr:plant-specific TFIIB-related protein PTF2 [Cocos nucifera]
MDACRICGEGQVVVDPDSGARICDSCGRVLSSDDFRHQTFTSDGVPTGSLMLSVGDFNHRDRRLQRARTLLADLAARLGLSPARAAEAAALASDVTDGALGDGQWFTVLAAACAYLVMRRHRLPLSLAEAAEAAGCEVHDLGRMAGRVARHLRLPPLPEFDAIHSLERAVLTSPSFAGIEREKAEQVIGQGRFLLQCATKWFLTTGRQPLPMVAAVAAFVAEVNGVKAGIEDIAKEIYAGVTTSKLRLKELMETLVEVAGSLLPWGADVTVKNLVQNAPLLIRIMELKSKSSSVEGSEGGLGFDLGDLLNAYYSNSREDGDSKYFNNVGHEEGGLEMMSCVKLENLKVSGECLSNAYKNVLERISCLKEKGELGKDQGKKRRIAGLDSEALIGSWEGRWDSDKKLSLEQVLQRDVGYDALPPSFVTSVKTRRWRKEKIKAAKCRINEVMKPPSSSADSGGKEEDDVLEQMLGRKCRRRRRKRVERGGLDWEDCIIELLLLHGVKEDEIEQGHYNTLLALHVFNSLSTQRQTGPENSRVGDCW